MTGGAHKNGQVGVGRLVATNTVDPRSRELLVLKQGVTVGSDETNDFVIRDQTVSRRHAIITFNNGGLEIRDFNSTNGTFVNGKRVAHSARFDKGDRIRFGAADFIFLRNIPLESAVTTDVNYGGIAPIAKGRRLTEQQKGENSSATLDWCSLMEAAR